jgi:outer membrane protein
MNLKNIVLTLAILTLAINLFLTYSLYGRKNRVAFVKSSVMLEEYEGMKEAKKLYKVKAEGWGRQLDSLNTVYEEESAKYNQKLATLSEKEKKDEEIRVGLLFNKLLQIKAAIEKKAKEEDLEMTEGVLKQVNSYIEDFSKKNGYDVVIGTTLQGNLLYGNEAIDITRDLVEGLNKQYRGQ